MATFKHLLRPYRPYRTVAIFSIVATGILEIADLVVPYAIGQILNVLSQQPIDKPIQSLTNLVANLTPIQEGKLLSLGVLLGIIFLINVVKAPIQPWAVNWFHWAIALKSRRDQSEAVTAKILSLPLEFYDEHNPGRIAGRVARGLTNQTWTYPEIAGQLLPKLILVFGIFLLILFLEWRIAIAFIISFLLILSLTLRNLRRLIRREKSLDKYMESTESHTSELITNIKTVKAFATEAEELQRQNRRLSRELKVIVDRIHRGYT
ncbi:MAG: ABC transporter transmembrane domain-containing protein, partial [Spirulinaceae cyanobacterium]